MDDIAAEVADLKHAIDKSNELQEASNDLMRSLIDTLQRTAQEIADFREETRRQRQ